jgi:hypothetical protein
MLSKPKIYHFGTCDLCDSLESKDILSEYHWPAKSAGFSLNNTLYPYHSTSLMSLYSQPGSLGQRLYETLIREKAVDYIKQSLFNEVCKFPYFKYFKENVGPKDIFVLSFSMELYSKFVLDQQVITLLPLFKNSKIKWLEDEVLNKVDHHLDFDDERSLGITKELIEQFSRDIYETFGHRVLCVETVFSDKFMVKDGDMEKIRDCKVGYTNIPFYRNTKMLSSAKDHEYGNRMVSVCLKYFKRCYPVDIPTVAIPKSMAYMDPLHKWGVSPFHLHADSSRYLTVKILDKLREISSKEH